MNVMDFTEKDYETLAEALVAWESAPIGDGMTQSLISAIMGGGGKAAMEKEMHAAAQKKKQRISIAIVLKAKVELARQAAQAAAIQASEGRES